SAVETTSSADGRFRIPARVLFEPPLAFPIEGPEIALFKAGYGGWKFRGSRPPAQASSPGSVIPRRAVAPKGRSVSPGECTERSLSHSFMRMSGKQSPKHDYTSRSLAAAAEAQMPECGGTAEANAAWL